MLQLTQQQKDEVLKILRARLNRGSIWVFGSRVKSLTPKKFSDLDLAFVDIIPLSLFELESIKEQFNSSDLPFKVDLCNLSELPVGIQEEVKKHHLILLEFSS